MSPQSTPLPFFPTPRNPGRRASDKPIEEYRRLIGEIQNNQQAAEKQSRELVQLHRRLEESHHRFVDLYQLAPVIYLTLGDDGAVMDINLKGAFVLGRSPSIILKKPFSQFVVTEDMSLFSVFFQKCRAAGREVAAEFRILSKQAQPIPVQVTGIQVERGSQSVVQIAMMDLSERKRIEQELLQKEQELQQSRRIEAIGRLAGGVAHDFNNLLAGIMGVSQGIFDSLSVNDPRRAELQDVLDASDRAFTLTRQLLAFGRRQMVAPRILDLNQVIANMNKMLRRLIGEDVQLLFSPCDKLELVQADEGQLEQIVTNLLINARDAMPHGGRITIETARVELSVEQLHRFADLTAGPYAVLRVIDTGVGMDSETLKRIFEPFFTTKAKDKGTGLGLATVHGIVKQHRGEVLVHSHPGRGTTFEIFLPSAGEAAQLSALKPHPAEQIPAPAGGGESILLVEDETIVRKVAGNLLQKKGYRVIAASDGPHALAVLAAVAQPIDLLITDVVMPNMTGVELAAHVQKRCPGLPVLYMSGYPEDIIAKRGILNPDVPFIEKTQIVKSLCEKVRRLLDEPKAKASNATAARSSARDLPDRC